MLHCPSEIDVSDTTEEDEVINAEEEEREDEDVIFDEYGLGDRERSAFCAAFTLMDTDGDGILTPRTTTNLLAALSREITEDNINDIDPYCKAKNCDGETRMDFTGFYQFLASQLVGVDDEAELREAFEVLGSIFRKDNPTPPGFTNVVELRHLLKNYGLRLTDEEIDYLWNEEDNWMLKEYLIETEILIKKLLEDVNNVKLRKIKSATSHL